MTDVKWKKGMSNWMRVVMVVVVVQIGPQSPHISAQAVGWVVGLVSWMGTQEKE